MPDPAPAIKRHRRIGLWAPWILALLIVIGWSGYWFVLKGQLEATMDGEADRLREAGYDLSWKTRTVGGFPFRFEVALSDARIAEPSGWGLAAPRLEGVAAAYKVDHWVLVAPQGLTLSRPGAGAVDVDGEVLRASIAEARVAPRFSFEGRKLTFRLQPGAKPFAFNAADLWEVHLRPAGGERLDLHWRMQNAQTNRTGLFAQIAPLAPLNFRVSAHLDHRDRFRGGNWADAVKAWTAAGGAATVDQMTASVGEVSLDARGGPLTVGYDGRLRGALDLNLRQGAAALTALGRNEAIDPAQAASAAAVARARGDGQGAQLRLTFQAGMATLGPVRISPAPKVY